MDSIFHVGRMLIVTTITFVMAIAATPLLTNFLYRKKLGKQIRTGEESPIFQSLHQKKEGTPTMGGVLVWGSVFILALFLAIVAYFFPGSSIAKLDFLNREQTYLPLGMMVFAGIIGLLDDILGMLKKGWGGGGIRFKHRILMYGLVAIVGASWFFLKLDWDVIRIPFVGFFNIGWMYIPLFAFIIIATSFSTNQTDGLDGLAGGILLIGFLSLVAVSFVQGRYDLAVMGSAVVGGLLGFLWFNIYPARFFMGDTGSMSLGVTLGVLAMFTNTFLLLPLFGFVLVLEAGSTILQIASKKLRGKKIFLSAPIHHHFEAKGWPETKVTMRFWILGLIGAVVGLILVFLDRIIIQ